MNKLCKDIEANLENFKASIKDIGVYYPKIHRKAEHNNVFDKTFKLWLGTVVRIKGTQDLWFDVPIIEHIVFTDLQDIQIHNFYESFNIKAYKTMNMYIPNTHNAIISKYQISEQERILKAHQEKQI